MFGKKNKLPAERYRAADKKRQKLRDKRNKLELSDPNFEKKDQKFMKAIHKQNVEMQIAEMELSNPAQKNTTVNATVNFNKTVNNKSIQFHGHGHYHNHKKS